MKRVLSVALFLYLLIGSSCTDYTPKPRGYFRIEPPAARYQVLSLDSLPYSFNVSQLATVELPEAGSPEGWINLSYPSLGVKIYCSYLPVTPATLPVAASESRSLVSRQIKTANEVKVQEYSNSEERVYFFRGALYYDCVPNADSLAPVTDYLRKDIIELIQSFSWKK